MNTAALAEIWREVVENPHLRDLPFKLELNENGKVEFAMSPASNRHSLFQGRLLEWLLQHFPEGIRMPECSILTHKGVKVADVVWASNAFYATHGDETPYPKAPELCVEIAFPSNTADELAEKTRLYLDAGGRSGLCGRMARWNCMAPRDGESNPLSALRSTHWSFGENDSQEISHKDAMKIHQSPGWCNYDIA